MSGGISTVAAITEAADRLRAQGLKQGDRVALQVQNSVEAVYLVAACWRLGAVAVPLSTRYTEEQADRLCQEQLLSLRVCDAPEREGWVELSTQVSEPSAEFSQVTLKALDLNLDLPASIVFSSGSTGVPKGVLHSLANHYCSALGSDANIPFRRGDRWLVSLPLYHMGGLALVMRALLHGGGLVFPRGGESLADAIRRTGATHLSLVPTQLRSLLPEARNLDLKAVLVGGAACPATLVCAACTGGLPVFLTYGSTEMASQVTTTALGEAVQEPTCSGRALAQRELRLDQDGEIWVRGETRFLGYVYGETVEPPFDAEGWFATGDLGRLDTEGRLFVLGRRDTMFISGGENIYPEEIEKALLERLGAEACVVVPVPDERYGQRPVAFVKTSRCLPARDDLALDLERFKWPDRIESWPNDVPVSSKPDRLLFRGLALK